MPFVLMLLGFAKSLLGFGLSLLKALMDWASQHPLLALAIAVDIILLAGCWWGLKQHNRANTEAVQITSLKTDNASLATRLKQYSEALTDAQRALVNTIEGNNKAIENLKKAADAQLAKAQALAAQTAKQRDAYAALAAKYQHAGPTGATPQQRIDNEHALNGAFINDFGKVK